MATTTYGIYTPNRRATSVGHPQTFRLAGGGKGFRKHSGRSRGSVRRGRR